VDDNRKGTRQQPSFGSDGRKKTGVPGRQFGRKRGGGRGRGESSIRVKRAGVLRGSDRKPFTSNVPTCERRRTRHNKTRKRAQGKMEVEKKVCTSVTLGREDLKLHIWKNGHTE